MIKLERHHSFKVRRRVNWVVLFLGPDRHLLTVAEALDLANQLVDASESEPA